MHLLETFLEKTERVPLMPAPTPLHRLHRLEEQWGCPKIYIKRDDMTGIGPGGNKIRSLEYILGEAVKEGSKVILAAGKPVYLEERRTEEELCYIKEVQDGIVEYFEDFIKYRDVDDLDAKDISLGEIFLKFITPQYSTIINNIFRTYIIDDEFHNENLHVSNIYQY